MEILVVLVGIGGFGLGVGLGWGLDKLNDWLHARRAHRAKAQEHEAWNLATLATDPDWQFEVACHGGDARKHYLSLSPTDAATKVQAASDKHWVKALGNNFGVPQGVGSVQVTMVGGGGGGSGGTQVYGQGGGGCYVNVTPAHPFGNGGGGSNGAP